MTRILSVKILSQPLLERIRNCWFFIGLISGFSIYHALATFVMYSS